jgi:hypothetical protein
MSRTLHHAAIEWGARACIERGIDQLGVDLMVWPYPRLTIVAVRLLTARIWTNLSKWQQSRLSLAGSTTIAAGSDQRSEVNENRSRAFVRTLSRAFRRFVDIASLGSRE